ncbi:hypothetical protein [Kitasatospora sp. HPMI-4]|uniref:hypothetical protein n=1 Tax=Kitasatospora sp. HPMI-4 TaxID=3448443 RepID=UPI003F1BF23B
MQQSFIPAPDRTIEVQVFDAAVFAASGRQLIAGGKRGPAFDPCAHCDGAGEALITVRDIDTGENQLVTVYCPACGPEAGAR